MSMIVTLEPLKPLVECGRCGKNIYTVHAHCQASAGPQSDCPLLGEQWSRMRLAYDATNVWPSRPVGEG